MLNSVYNGPPIPAKPTKSHYRPGRGGDGCCCCCGCLECLCGCVFSLIFKLFLTVLVILGIVVLVLWLVFKPNKVTFRVTDASLSRFDLNANTNNLDFDLNLNLSIRNSNRKIGFYYTSLEARALYDDQRIGSKFLDPFYQGKKNTTDLSLAIKGTSLVKLEGSDGGVTKYGEEKASGVFEIDLKIIIKTKLKLFWGIKSHKFKAKVNCDLKVPLSNSTAVFNNTKCDFDF